MFHKSRKAMSPGGLMVSGVAIALFFIVITMVNYIGVIINTTLKDSANETYGETSAAVTVASYGTNGTVRMQRGVPSAASVSVIALVILVIGFAITGFMSNRQGGGGSPPQLYTGGGFGG